MIFLKTRGWLVERMIGNAFQSGIPDLFIYHRKWGFRWVDVKSPKRYSFTKAQKIKWPKWEQAGLGIWIITEASEDGTDCLYGPPNWRNFVKKSWNIPTLKEIDAMLEKL
jgi:hypothetical protein